MVLYLQAAWGAACHFEATGARKCFPCMDQPEFRSTFDISVKRPNQHVEVCFKSFKYSYYID